MSGSNQRRTASARAGPPDSASRLVKTASLPIIPLCATGSRSPEAQRDQALDEMMSGTAFAVLAIVLVIGGAEAGALFVIPCMLMMWMRGGAGGKSPGDRSAR